LVQHHLYKAQKWLTYNVSIFSLEQYENELETFMLHIKAFDETWLQALSLNRNGSGANVAFQAFHIQRNFVRNPAGAKRCWLLPPIFVVSSFVKGDDTAQACITIIVVSFKVQVTGSVSLPLGTSVRCCGTQHDANFCIPLMFLIMS
jgi:hypothetical protein